MELRSTPPIESKPSADWPSTAGDFSRLSTEQFRLRIRPAAIAIYTSIWPSALIKDLRGEQAGVHVLDKEFGIDAIVQFPDGQWLTLQEKFRRAGVLRRFGEEFTQEYKNAAGTPYESDGEWFKLGAQLYFVGWANDAEDDFERWVLLDVAKYKLLVLQFGGLDKLGTLQRNDRFGRASFYAIPIRRLEPAIILEGQEGVPF